MIRLAAIAASLSFALSATGGLMRTVPPGANLERFEYPAPARWPDAPSPGRPVRMAYRHRMPAGRGNGATVVLLHGGNVCAATWGETARGSWWRASG